MLSARSRAASLKSATSKVSWVTVSMIWSALARRSRRSSPSAASGYSRRRTEVFPVGRDGVLRSGHDRREEVGREVPPIFVSLEKLDKRLLEASADLGSKPWQSFLQITLPLSLPGVATGSMLVFILLMGDYILPQFLGGGKVYFIGNALVDLFLQSRNWPFGAAVSIALVIIMFVTIYFYMRFVLSKTDQRRVAMI